MTTPADLIAEHNQLDDWVKSETKRFGEHIKPAKVRLEEIENQLLAFLNSTRQESAKTDAGTAYKSTIMTPKVVNRDQYLDFVEQQWDTWGNEMLQVSAPQKDALKTFIDQNGGTLPPGVDVAYFTRVNVRRS